MCGIAISLDEAVGIEHNGTLYNMLTIVKQTNHPVIKEMEDMVESKGSKQIEKQGKNPAQTSTVLE